MSDYRCSLRAKVASADQVFGKNEQSNILYPLRKYNRLYFPYTPTIQGGNSAEYEEFMFTHSIYKYPAYKSSRPDDIVLTADFTAQTTEEARYLLAVMHFFKSATKSYFGDSNSRAGTPPPVLFFNYLGRYNFNDVPVVISNYTYTIGNESTFVDIPDFDTQVPTEISFNITLMPFYNPKDIRDNFDLDKFTNGEQFKKGYL